MLIAGLEAIVAVRAAPGINAGALSDAPPEGLDVRPCSATLGANSSVLATDLLCAAVLLAEEIAEGAILLATLVVTSGGATPSAAINGGLEAGDILIDVQPFGCVVLVLDCVGLIGPIRFAEDAAVGLRSVEGAVSGGVVSGVVGSGSGGSTSSAKGSSEWGTGAGGGAWSGIVGGASAGVGAKTGRVGTGWNRGAGGMTNASSAGAASSPCRQRLQPSRHRISQDLPVAFPPEAIVWQSSGAQWSVEHGS